MTNDSTRMQSRKNGRIFGCPTRETCLWWACWTLLIVSLCLIIADVARFHFFWDWFGYAQQGGVLAASCIATLGVLSGVRSWADEIRVKRDDAAQAAYVKLVNYLMNQFVPKGGNRDLAAMRADVVLRASQPVMEKLAEYNPVVSKIIGETSSEPGEPDGDVRELTPQESALIRQKTAQMFAVVRSECGFTDTDLDTIERALFDGVPEVRTPEDAPDSELK